MSEQAMKDMRFERINAAVQMSNDLCIPRDQIMDMLKIQDDMHRQVERATEPDILFPYQEWAARSEKDWKERGKCSYCGSEWHENRFHPGTCDECGGPR